MNERDVKPMKKPFLREDSGVSMPEGGQGKKRSLKINQGPELGDNDFLRPQGSLWMWLGFLAIPLIVLAFAYVQGLLFGEQVEAVQEPQAVQESVQDPASNVRDQRLNEIYQKRLERRQ